MFNIGPTELLVILAIALLIVGPTRLPELGKTIGKSLREFRRAQEELKGTFDLSVMDEPVVKGPSTAGRATSAPAPAAQADAEPDPEDPDPTAT